MTIAPPDTGRTVATPRRRLRKRWIILATFVGLMVFSGWLIFREVPLAVMRLPDGRSFTIHKLTYGTQHQYRTAPVALTPAEAWVNQWLERIGREIQVSHRGGGFSNYTPSVAVWHSFDWSKKTPESTPHWIVLTDSHGWRTSMSTLHLQNAPPPPPGIAGKPTTPPWAAFALPTPSPELKVELLNAKGDQLASVRLPYDAPKALQQQWTAQSLQVTETDGNMSVTLKALHADWVKVEPGTPTVSDALAVTPEFTIAVDGMDSPNWTPMTEGVPFFENFGANQVAATVLSPQGTSAPFTHCTMSPHESLWKLHLPFICRNPDEVLASDRVSLGRVAFNDKQSAVAETRAAVTLGKSDVRLLGAGWAGSFDYEGAGEANFPMPAQPIEYWTRNQLKGTFQTTHAAGNYSTAYASGATPGKIVRQPQVSMTVGLKFTAPRPHVVISLDASGDRFPFVIVKDENGRLLEGELFNAQGLLIWLAKNAYDDVQEVDVTLLLQKPRVFTFVVPPPTVPPRPASVQKTQGRTDS